MSVYMKLLVVIALTLILSHVAVHSARDRRDKPRTMTDRQKADIVYTHNDLRAHEDAADMEMITWNKTLALGAAEFVEQCIWRPHDPVLLPNNPPLPGTNFTSYGQNLYMTTSASISMVDAVHSWYKEKYDYTYKTSTCTNGTTCGNYTQMVWARTSQIGCAYHYCTIMEESTAMHVEFLVCNYMPMGNHLGLKPFKKGPACSKCTSGAAWCTEKLCNRKCSKTGGDCWCAAQCYNCATLDRKTCRCSCADGWYGTDCKRRCKDKAKRCTDKRICGSPLKAEACPVMCKLCKPDPDAKPGECPPVYGQAAHPARSKVANSSQLSQHQQQRHAVTLISYVIQLILSLAITSIGLVLL